MKLLAEDGRNTFLNISLHISSGRVHFARIITKEMKIKNPIVQRYIWTMVHIFSRRKQFLDAIGWEQGFLKAFLFNITRPAEGNNGLSKVKTDEKDSSSCSRATYLVVFFKNRTDNGNIRIMRESRFNQGTISRISVGEVEHWGDWLLKTLSFKGRREPPSPFRWSSHRDGRPLSPGATGSGRDTSNPTDSAACPSQLTTWQWQSNEHAYWFYTEGILLINQQRTGTHSHQGWRWLAL